MQVRLYVSRSSFGETLGAMREWLDRNKCQTARFETASSGDAILISIEFENDALGAHFGRAFNLPTAIAA